METNIEKKNESDNVKTIFIVVGVVLGGLTLGLVQEGIVPAIIGAILGLGFALFFTNVLLVGRTHDR